MKKFTSLLLAATFAVANMQAATSETLYIIGDFNSWNLGTAPEMEKTAENTFTWTGNINSGIKFKFIPERKWALSYTCNWDTETVTHQNITPGESYTIYEKGESDGKDNKFQITTTGNYTVNVNLTDMKMTCTLNEDVEVPVDLYIIGDATEAGWTTQLPTLSNSKNKQKLTLEENGHYTWYGQLTDKGDGCFRFITSDKWWPSYTTVETDKTHAVENGDFELRFCETSPSPDAAFKIAQTGIYAIDLDIETLTMKIERQYPQLYILGNASESDWNQGKWNYLPLVMGENHTATWTGNLKPGEFRLQPSKNWWPSVTTAQTDGNEALADGGTYTIKYVQDAGKSFSITEEGNYTLAVDFIAMTMTVTKNGETVETPEELYICGSALHNVEGSNWNVEERVSKMTPTENPNEFSWSGQMYVEGGNQFKFRNYPAGHPSWEGYVNETDSDLPIESGQTYKIVKSTDQGAGDGKWTIAESGEYIVKANTADKTMTISKKTTDGLDAVNAEGFSVKVSGRTISVEGEATVYDALGRTAGTIANGTLTLPAAGIYIVAANGNTAKVAVK